MEHFDVRRNLSVRMIVLGNQFTGCDLADVVVSVIAVGMGMQLPSRDP